MMEFDLIALHRFREQAAKVQGDLVQLAQLGAAGELKKLEAEMAADALYYARSITPVKTGALQRSHIITVLAAHTLVHINPDAVNPFSPEDPPEYGPKVHARGGHRAFYDRTVAEYGPVILQKAEDDAVELVRLEAIA